MTKSIKLLNHDYGIISSIVSYFNLTEPLDYYDLYNSTNYHDIYHGKYHVLNGLFSIMYFGKDNLKYHHLQSLMSAFIFHDFNYVGCDPDNLNYDDINIHAALKGFSGYLEQCQEKDLNRDVQTEYNHLSKLIHATRYPILKTKDELSDLQTFIIDVDHSMCLFSNYNKMIFDLVTKELKYTDTSKIIELGLDYLENRMFYNENIQEFWNQCKSTVIKNFINYFNDESIKTKLNINYVEMKDSQYLCLG